MSVEKTTKVAAKKRGRPVKTSDKRAELMKRAEEATKKQYSEFDLHQARQVAFEAGFDAGESFNEIPEEIAEDLFKWVRRQAIKGVILNVLLIVTILVVLVTGFLSVHDWAMNLQ